MSKPCAAACRTGADINIYYGGISSPFLFFRGGVEDEDEEGRVGDEAHKRRGGPVGVGCVSTFSCLYFFLGVEF